MGALVVSNVGKAYKRYPGKWARAAEWVAGGERHQKAWVLRDISFTIEPGEAVGIIGVNGAGKSTLLKIITGTTQPTMGSVKLQGRVAALLELGMGFHPDFTGRQNVYMAGQLLGLRPQQITDCMPAIEAFAEIGDYMDRPVRTYSSGMQMRVAFSIATAVRPDVLIVDEALSVGDAYFQHKSFGRIREFQEKKTTLLLVSHDAAAVRAICGRAIWLDKGVVRKQGATKNVVDDYMASLYEGRQEVNGASVANRESNEERAPKSTWRRDLRQDFVNTTELRNDIRISDHLETTGRWGDGNVKIETVRLTDAEGNTLSWMIGGEEAIVNVEAIALENLDRIFLGFLVRDRLGQPLFGDNTFVESLRRPISAAKGQRISASFRFLMPILPHGSYAVTAAVARGTQTDHVINDWINQSIMFESHNRTTISGMIGIPMHEIDVKVCTS